MHTFSHRWIAITLVALMTATSLPQITAEHGATPLIIVKLGQNRDFHAGEIVHGYDLPCSENDCDYDITNADARGAARLVDTTGTEEGEQGLSWAFEIEAACADQSTNAPFTLQFSYDYTIVEDAALVGSVADGEVRLYSTQGASPTSGATLAGSGSTTTPVTQIGVVLDTAYTPSITGYAKVVHTDAPLLPDSAAATTDIEATFMKLDFGDDFPPTTEGRLSPAGLEAIGTFLGYSNADAVQVFAQGTDPAINALNESIAQSCVKEIVFQSNGNAEIKDVGFDQGEVNSSAIFTDEGRQDLLIFARDWANNQPSAPESSHFVIDRTAPDTNVPLDRAANGFPNETGVRWFANQTPNWVLSCIRDPTGLGMTNVAPCRRFHISSDGGNTWQDVTTTDDSLIRTTGTGRGLNVLVKSTDAAGNTGTAVLSDTINVDIQKPGDRVDRSTPEGNIPGWHKDATTLDIECTGDDISGCYFVETSTDGGATWSNDDMFDCTTERLVMIRYHVWDKAGNTPDKTVRFGCDFTLPPAIDVANDTPVFENPLTGITYSNVTPRVKWPASVDPFVDGVASNVTKYEVEFNEVPGFAYVNAPATTYTLTAAVEGWNCVRVRAIDGANNAAVWSPEYCVFVDRISPTLDFFAPETNSVYLLGEKIANVAIDVEGMPAPVVDNVPRELHSVVIGPLIVGTNSADTGSKLYNMHLVEDRLPLYPEDDGRHGDAWFDASATQDKRWDNNNTAPGCVDLDVQRHTCAWHDGANDDPQSTPNAAAHFLFGRVWDNANNRVVMVRNYTRLNVALLETACGLATGKTCSQVVFAPATQVVANFDATKFLRYSVYGWADGSTYNPLDPTQLVGTSTSLMETRVNDVFATRQDVGSTYHYKVVIELTDGTVYEDEYPTPYITYRNAAGHLNSAWIREIVQETL